MAPPKKGELVKGQASLANFFSGGGLTPAAVKAQKGQGSPESAKKTPSPKKKAKSDQGEVSSLDRQQVTEIKDKVRREVRRQCFKGLR